MSTTLQGNIARTIQSNVGALHSIDTALQQVFATQAHTKAQKARVIMGAIVKQLSDEELEVKITEIQYLLDAWFDEFERLNLDGQTLKELLVE